jgi:hypothetical protein
MHSLDAGYALASCLSPAECDHLTAALTHGDVPRTRAGARHLMAHPAVAALANDTRLIDLAKPWLGPVAIPFRATLFDKSLDTNWLIPWHQDTALPLAAKFDRLGWGPWSSKSGANYAHASASALSRVVALRVHLDASTAGNGPLRVIPGSHRHGILTDAAVLEFAATHEPVACAADRGAIIAMRPLLIHSSSKATTSEPRRVLHIEYADSLDFGDGIRLAVV